MTLYRAFFVSIAVVVLVTPAAWTQTTDLDHVIYEEPYHDPVLKEMREKAEAAVEAAATKTAEILETIEEAQEKQRENRPELRFDMSSIARPEGPEAFETTWHFPPTPQFMTGTCWSFSATSFFESEIHRLSGREIRLSEMWTAYWEYLEKAERWIERRGESQFEQGSESNAVVRIWNEYGVVPREAYEGVLAEDGRFDHNKMHDDMKSFLEWCRANNFWDEDVILTTLRSIMDSWMGRPPETVTWEGDTYTPQEFLQRVVRLPLDEYVGLMSTLSAPFYTRAEFDVPDNWWEDDSYVNVPLDVWYGAVRSAIRSGSSVVIGGDVSEPGKWGFEDIAVVPTFDIPQAYINQDSRELRIYNHTTTDDHGVHLVGWVETAGHDWYLIKDSGRSSRAGDLHGYYMFRDDFVRLKMLTFMVHRDFVEDILERVEATKREQAESEGEGA